MSCFDLHFCLSGDTIKVRKTLPADLIDSDFNAAFELYADRKKFGGYGFALDFAQIREKFFKAVGSRKAAENFLNLVERAPKNWHIWYYGLLTARADKSLRIDFFEGTRELAAMPFGIIALQRRQAFRRQSIFSSRRKINEVKHL